MSGRWCPTFEEPGRKDGESQLFFFLRALSPPIPLRGLRGLKKLNKWLERIAVSFQS
jgi:hypothetical protein